MKRQRLTKSELKKALLYLDPLPGRRRAILVAHYGMSGHVGTASKLAQKVGYKHFAGLNLQYGLLAKNVARVAGLDEANLSLLVDFVRPKEVRNRDWLLVLRPEVAEALRELKWV